MVPNVVILMVVVSGAGVVNDASNKRRLVAE